MNKKERYVFEMRAGRQQACSTPFLLDAAAPAISRPRVIEFRVIAWGSWSEYSKNPGPQS